MPTGLRAGGWRKLFAVPILVLLMLLGVAAPSSVQAQLSPLTPTYNASCAFNGCHGAALPPAGGRINAANAPAVISAANTIFGMGIGGLSAATLATIATELNTFFATQIAPQAATVNYLSANNSITISSLVRNGATSVVQSTSQVAAPANGNLTVGTPASLAVSYSHTAANTCSDTFQVAGTGAATTAARTVNITITPPTLTATNSAAAIAYNSTGFTAVPLNLTGPASGITITTNLPANSGTLQTAGGAISYQADPVNYVPQVTFQYRATGPCGSQSAIATVTLNVNPPGPPGANPVAANVAFQTATAVTANVVGPFDLLTIVTAPVNGTVPAPALNATSFTYTPRAGFIGTDTFTYTARAPGGGASPSATVP